MTIRIPEMAPCGVFCGACPSFGKTCLGCASENPAQKRRSKWGCKVRNCCYQEQALDFCCECSQFPCTKHKKKLLDTHPGDPRFTYRHEVPENFIMLGKLGLPAYLAAQQERWICPHCGGRVIFYDYRCLNCGEAVHVTW